MATPFICPYCRGPLVDPLACEACDRSYSIDDGIADFAEAHYYDRYEPGQPLPDDHLAGLEAEFIGTQSRIVDYYLPRLPRGARVLDCGAGNGLSVDLLAERGFDAWGVDLSQLRKWQWRERTQRERLVVADALRLPFPKGFFDVAISSGVIEHIGVAEARDPDYRVAPLSNRDEQRRRFLAELIRVTSRDGAVYVDCPHGAFPIDFWHRGTGRGLRFHRLDEGFLPKFGEIRRLVRELDPTLRVEALSPHRRLRFRQVRQRWYGVLFSAPVSLLFRAMSLPLLRVLARTGLNPFLVVKISRPPSS
jgi:SAM-dependent methyltransferase